MLNYLVYWDKTFKLSYKYVYFVAVILELILDCDAEIKM